VIFFTEATEGRPNEDAVQVRELGGERWMGAVADGQGGRAGAAKAAQRACAEVLERTGDLLAGRPSDAIGWWNLFKWIDGQVQRDDEAGLTTLIAFVVESGYVYGAACGDSAAYLYNARTQLLDLTAGQQKNPQIGSGMTSCTFFSSPLAKPWSLLVMTDGVWKYVGRSRIAELLATAGDKDLATRLADAGRLPGSGKFPDDFTFALIEG